jgi:hypothetical protein
MNKLKKLVDKKYIYFFESGDDAIWALLSLLSKTHKKIIVPDFGGWFSYKKFPPKLGMDIIELKTDDALIDIADLKSKFLENSDNSIVLINSMGGYFVVEPMEEIFEICGNNLINDVSASIGTDDAKIGELCVGSFGEHKPLELSYGGFIGSNIELDVPNISMREGFIKELEEAIDILDEKREFWNNHRITIIKDLEKHQILHKESAGINVIVAYDDEKEMHLLIQYCEEAGIEYKKCPNYIKVNRQAISFEIKRIKFKYT